MRTLHPKCLESDAEFGNTSLGYLLPCCWWDQPNLFETDLKDLLKDKFKISNVESIDDILNSEEWLLFYNNLKNNIAPEHCFKMCGKFGKNFEIK